MLTDNERRERTVISERLPCPALQQYPYYFLLPPQHGVMQCRAPREATRLQIYTRPVGQEQLYSLDVAMEGSCLQGQPPSRDRNVGSARAEGRLHELAEQVDGVLL